MPMTIRMSMTMSIPMTIRTSMTITITTRMSTGDFRT